MPRNYDTTNGLPYPRVTDIAIKYRETGELFVHYRERMAIVDAGGVVRLLDGGETEHALSLPLQPVGLVNPATGAQIPGSTTVPSLLMNVTAMIRRDQLLRDGEANPLQPLA